MKYVSLDIETTGLNPEVDQILSIAATIDDLRKPHIPIKELPSRVWHIKHNRLVGNPMAFAMNASLLERMADPANANMLVEGRMVCTHLRNWLQSNDLESMLTFAGRDLIRFDFPFISAVKPSQGLGGFGFHDLQKRIHRRVLDPITFFVEPSDVAPPGLADCMARCPDKLPEWTRHEALSDTHAVIHLIRYIQKIKTTF